MQAIRHVPDKTEDESRSGVSAFGLRITRVETVPLHVPFRRTFKNTAGVWPYSEVLLVRLHTAEGITGVGETQAWRRAGSFDTLPNMVRTIHDFFTPRIIGRSPFDIADIMRSLDRALDHNLYSKAAISDALFDLQGQALGCPLYQILGGKCRDEFALCAPIGLKDEHVELLDTARALYDRGFRAFLLKIGADARADYANVRAVREMLGPDATLRVDANASMSFDDALMLLKKLEPFDIDSAEQPVAIWDLDGMAELARRVDIPIMADEAVCDEHDLINVIKKRAATILQTKQAKNGGLWTVRKLWTIAAAAGLRIYPGNHASTSVATAAVAHLAAAWPGDLVDGPFAMGITGELAEDVVTEPLKVFGNKLKVPTGPGLGVTIDDDKIRRMRVDL